MTKKGGGKGTGGQRDLTVRVKTARGRKRSSTLWLQRQLNDPYVAQAKREGYRSRAAFKIIELHEKFHLFKPGQKIVDLGAAPGGWTQVALDVMQDKGMVIGIDLLPIEPIGGAVFLEKDFTDEDAPEMLLEHLDGKADVVMSDMAANTTGHAPTDHVRIMLLCEMAYDFAIQILKPGGAFLCKVRQGGTEGDLLKTMKRDFALVKHAKPESSRKGSAESYVVATGFRGQN